MKRVVTYNDCGFRIGECHPRAKLTNHDVELIIQLVDEGLSCREVAIKFGVTRAYVHLISQGLRRSQWVDRAIRVEVGMDRGDQ